ncbi:cAMP-independent regulatory protein [Coprinopsis cinerea okayama7|uniref:cAMP-independent regulatory protein n=1 Tax=Coprinopsis cinerea (strain Okayama-7 / 130 / ATCC MYA-4618 / FGSC 9003) TaxID=240176 RepID=A8P296_COPC7|nr:cAMP-independent regulatory protein [Coprinopsis cinerea okayama7\|eukprot:XP_001838267.1 cAMP-independent regulatory protein [Coprinopsis cinerea okayama7\
MSAGQQGNTQQSSQTWTEPPWSGWIETTGDALLILEAARRGLIPRVTRRLVDSERKMITSGSVFVFDEEESGIKRWTDGFFWSPSRILGNFLLYRETDKRGNRNARNADPDSDSPDGSRSEGALSRPKNETTSLGIDKHRERSLYGSLTNSYKFKSDGLMKKTFSLTIGGVAQHLISYYKIEDVEQGRLRTPSSLPELASLEISPEYLDKTHFRNAPKVEVGADGILRYRGEGEEVESPSPSSSSSVVPHPIESNLPLLTDGHVAEGPSSSGKRSTKRYLPYGTTPHVRARRRSRSQADAPPPMGPASPLSPAEGSSVVLAPPPQTAAPLPHVPPATPAYATDTSAPMHTPSAYPPYPYLSPPPATMNYQPPAHVGSTMYPPQHAYPPPPPTTQPQAPLPQQVPQHPYPAYATPANPTSDPSSSSSTATPQQSTQNPTTSPHQQHQHPHPQPHQQQPVHHHHPPPHPPPPQTYPYSYYPPPHPPPVHVPPPPHPHAHMHTMQYAPYPHPGTAAPPPPPPHVWPSYPGYPPQPQPPQPHHQQPQPQQQQHQQHQAQIPAAPAAPVPTTLHAAVTQAQAAQQNHTAHPPHNTHSPHITHSPHPQPSTPQMPDGQVHGGVGVGLGVGVPTSADRTEVQTGQ